MDCLFVIVSAPPVPPSSLPDVPPSVVGQSNFALVLNHWIGVGVDVFNSLFEMEIVPGVTVGWFVVAVFVLTVAIEMLYGKIVK